jgi:acetyltransferase AlgX (SGNH hydrolase-like protein)
MNKKQTKIIKVFLYLFLVIVFLPMLQFSFSPFKLGGLQGAYLLSTMPKLTTSSFLNQNYQDCTAIYLKHQTPFRAELIKVRNQIDYTIHKKINTILTLGKDNYIFDPTYIKAIKGEDYLDDEVLNNKITSILKTKTILDSLNIPMLICLAPNKANFYSEKLIPTPIKVEATNHNYFKKNLLKNGINFIDFDSIFNELKTTSKYPLIPKYGAHWSTFGAYLSANILFDKLNSITKKTTSSLILDSVYITTKVKYTDDDYLPSLNLLEKLKSPPMAYPVVNFNIKNKLNALIISDSFFWNFYDLDIPKNSLTQNSELWYYNKTKFDIDKNTIGTTSGFINPEDIIHRNVIIILSADPSLVDFGFGFFEQIEQLHEQ